MTTDPCKELIYRGMDYSCCYLECAESNCVVQDCKGTTTRASLWFLGMWRNSETCWIPLCEEHEPRPEDTPPGLEDDEEEE